jgi:hypothetical protein
MGIVINSFVCEMHIKQGVRNMKLFARLNIAVIAMVMLIQLGCDDYASSPDPIPIAGTLKISVKSVYSGAFNKSMGNTAVLSVTITSAQLVIDEIEFESDAGDSLDFEFEEPFIQDLSLDTNLHEIQTVQVPFGTYEESEIEIDKLTEKDSLLYAQNPELQDRSILVEGFLDDDTSQIFVFSSDLSVGQEREFDPPLVIDENSPSTNIVLIVNLDTWFVDEDGDPLDPRSPGNRETIEENIKNSIDLFEDEDDDGEEDDDDNIPFLKVLAPLGGDEV